jgi:hypothetical protein
MFIDVTECAGRPTLLALVSGSVAQELEAREDEATVADAMAVRAAIIPQGHACACLRTFMHVYVHVRDMCVTLRACTCEDEAAVADAMAACAVVTSPHAHAPCVLMHVCVCA